MAVKTSQRWGILIIMAVLVVGTLGSFAVMILTQKNQAKLAAEYQKALDVYTKEQKAYQAKVDAQSKELSAQYYPTFSQYSSQVGSYDIDSVTALGSEDLLVGDGEEIGGTTAFAAYYIGWDANGKVFDQSIDSSTSSLKAPLSVATGLDSASLIDGWKEGIKGMRLGGVRLLTIPSDKAYKEKGSTDSSGNVVIAPNMPLKFIMMAIPVPPTIEQPASLTAAQQKYFESYTAYYGAGS